MITVYYNSACSKCRITHEILEKSGEKFEVVEYLKNPPTPAELDALLTQLGKEPIDIVRKGEDAYKELKLDSSPPKTRADWIKIMVANPILIERPIVTDGKAAVVGRPPENVEKWLKQRG